jgi:tetratricopeptide (TPR) repeat protein
MMARAARRGDRSVRHQGLFASILVLLLLASITAEAQQSRRRPGLPAPQRPTASSEYPTELVGAPKLEPTFRRYTELYAKGDFSGALREAQKLQADARASFGSKHQNYVVAVIGLAHTHDAQGKLARAEGRYAAAEQSFKRALSLNEEGLGGNHIEVAITLLDLASVYVRDGKQSEAEGLTQRARVIVGGPDAGRRAPRNVPEHSPDDGLPGSD